jgi:hypothetical protein
MITERQILEQTIEIHGYVALNELNLRKAYGNEFLAVGKSGVVDHDLDEFELIRRSTSGKTVIYGTIDRLLDGVSKDLVTAARKRLKELPKAA